MGMPIVKALLKSMGGTISVKSELGRGTTFTVDLPFCNQPHTGEGRGSVG